MEKYLPIKIISLDKNVGLGNALKLGLKNCTYRLVARMDTDDICHPQRFEKQILQFENDNDLVLVGGNICEFNEDFSIKISKKGCQSAHKILKNMHNLGILLII